MLDKLEYNFSSWKITNEDKGTAEKLPKIAQYVKIFAPMKVTLPVPQISSAQCR